LPCSPAGRRRFWQILIGFFMLNASNGSYQNLLVKAALRGKTAQQLMSETLYTVDAEASLAELVDDVMLRHGVSFVPVLSGETLMGYADTAGVRSVAKEDWGSRSVREILVPAEADNTVAADTPLNEVFKFMMKSSRRKLMVVESRRLVGVISLSDLMHHMALEQEIGTRPGA
jgi:predicted transcriptional regulator